MAKLSKRTARLGVRLSPEEDLYEVDKERQYYLQRYPKLRGFHAKQREHIRRPMPERIENA